MLSVKAIYDGIHLRLLEPVNIDQPQEVIITFLGKDESGNHFANIDKAANRKKIMALAGEWDDMSEGDFHDYLNEAKRTGDDLFKRDVDL